MIHYKPSWKMRDFWFDNNQKSLIEWKKPSLLTLCKTPCIYDPDNTWTLEKNWAFGYIATFADSVTLMKIRIEGETAKETYYKLNRLARIALHGA